MGGGECIKTTDWPSTVQNENDPTKQTHHDTTCCGTQLAGKKNARVKKDTTATFTLLQGGERSRYTAQQNK